MSKPSVSPSLFSTALAWFLLIAGCSSSGQKSSLLKIAAPPEMPIQFEFNGFRFSPGRTCDNGWIDGSFCEATEPKQWTEEEFSIVKKWLDALPVSFMAQVRKNQFVTIYRYGHGFAKSPNGKYIRDEPTAWVWGVDHSINMSDLVLLDALPLDPISRYDIRQKTFVHELSHAFDGGTVGQDFLDLLGWQQEAGQWVLKGVDMGKVRSTYAEVQRLGWEGLKEQRSDKIVAALKLNREFGMANGFPTAYAMMNPSESFAEISSHLIVDPKFSQYMKQEVVKWFEKHVVPDLPVIIGQKEYDSYQQKLTEDFLKIPRNPQDKEWVKRDLSYMWARDQYMRNYPNVINLNRYTRDQTEYFWKAFFPKWVEIDAENTAELKDLLNIYPWFTISEFGQSADQQAWTIAQHADRDLSFQKKVLAILDALYPKGETNRSNYAYLFDRVASNEQRPQRYGTQGKCIGPGVWEPNPIENPDNVDNRRKEMELGTLADYIGLFRDICKW